MTELQEAQIRIVRLERTLGTLIIWIAQSATGVLSGDNANALLRMLEK